MSNVTVQEALNKLHDGLKKVNREHDVEHLILQLTEIKAALAEIDKCEPVINLNILKYTEHGVIPDDFKGQASGYRAGWNDCLSSIQYMFSQPIEKCEPVAEAIRERDRLGFAVVNVIGKLDEIIENTQEVEIDDFLHIAVPIDMWNELQAALEDMPERADLYTSPQPIEKCEPVGELILDPAFLPALKSPLVNWKINLVDLEVGTKFYTSPQPREWVGLSDLDIADAYYKAMNQELRPSDKVGVYKVSEAVEAKLKQLNTKG